MIRAVGFNGTDSGDSFSTDNSLVVQVGWLKRLLDQMWKRRRWLLMFLDMTVIFSGLLTAYYASYESGMSNWIPVVDGLGLEASGWIEYLRTGAIFSILWLSIMLRGGMYGHRLIQDNSLFSEIQSLVLAGAKALVVSLALSFIFSGLLPSILVYGVAFIFSGIGLISYRFFGRQVLPTFFHHCVSPRKNLIIGVNHSTIDFASKLLKQSHESEEVIGFLKFWDEKDSNHSDTLVGKILGIADDMVSLRTRIEFDRVILSAADFQNDGEGYRGELLLRILNYCETLSIPLYLIAHSTGIIISPSEVGSFKGVPLLLLRDSAQHPFYSVVKRILDIALSLAVLVLGLPLWIIVAIAIKLDSRGPVLYFQERVGMNGKPFKMIKFRSMIYNADDSLKDLVDFFSITEPVFNIRQDPRVTRIGAILRRTSMDEIPQFINVLKGDMSLVGPRPERTELVEMYNEYQWRRLKAKPGITGYQQVMSRGEPSLTKRIEYDLFYLKHQSLWLDLDIILKTVIVIARGDGMK